MHYLDIVLHLQFPFYNPPVSAGGRGWILAMLRENRPLYHAALGLASWHRSLAMREESGVGHGRDICRRNVTVDRPMEQGQLEQQLYGLAMR
jgi:hypothetical protein